MIARGHEVTNDNVIVSAPGRNGERGSVHVYTYVEGEAAWRLTQTVTGELWSLGESLHTTTKNTTKRKTNCGTGSPFFPLPHM